MCRIVLSVTLACMLACAFTLAGCTGGGISENNIDKHVVLSCNFDYLSVGDVRRYYATINPSSAGYELVWKTSDENVATVDENGTVTAVGAGVTTLTVSAVDKPYKASAKLTIADEIVDGSEGTDSLQQAVDRQKNDGSVLITSGYYPALTVRGRTTLTCAGDASVGGLKLEEGSELFAYSVRIYANGQNGESGLTVMDKNASLTAVGCSFVYDGEENSRDGFCIDARSDAGRIYLRACSFEGYKGCVSAGATDGEIYIVNSDFRDADTAVRIDLRVEGTVLDKNATGRISDNVYIGCKSCVELLYNASSYTGTLKIDDADLSVPS